MAPAETTSFPCFVLRRGTISCPEPLDPVVNTTVWHTSDDAHLEDSKDYAQLVSPFYAMRKMLQCMRTASVQPVGENSEADWLYVRDNGVDAIVPALQTLIDEQNAAEEGAFSSVMGIKVRKAEATVSLKWWVNPLLTLTRWLIYPCVVCRIPLAINM